MRDLTLTLTNTSYLRKPKSTSSVVRLNTAILAAIILFAGTYLFQVNSLSTKGYEIRQLELKLKQLEAEQKNLEVQAGSLQSINRIQQESQKLNFVPATNITYIKEADFALK